MGYFLKIMHMFFNYVVLDNQNWFKDVKICVEAMFSYLFVHMICYRNLCFKFVTYQFLFKTMQLNVLYLYFIE